MRFSAIVLPAQSPAEFLRVVQEVEAAGVERVWTYDHLSWRHLRDKPWFAAMPLLAAAAGGRFDLGVGAGADGPDASVLGAKKITARQRADRFADWVELLITLLEQQTVTATAGPYIAVDARMVPGCHQQPRPPLTIAAAGPRGMALAARFAHTWVTYGHPRRPAGEGHDIWLRGLRRQSRTLDDVAAEIGRARPRAAAVIRIDDTAPFESVQRFDDTIGELADAGFDDLYALWPRPDGTGMPLDLVHHMLDTAQSREFPPDHGGHAARLDHPSERALERRSR